MQSTQTSIKTKTAISDSRIIHHLKGDSPGPLVIFFGGIHGNESAGVIALEKKLSGISPKDIRGEVYGLYGNIEALKKNNRYIDEDLNRIWTTERMINLDNTTNNTNEINEQKALYKIILDLISKTKDPIYFIDFHTTSSITLPFITVNDALINRKYSSRFPVPVVLGIEEYLEGPLLSYLNKLGYVSIGFESGQHNDPDSVINFEAFIILSLFESEVLTNTNQDEIIACKKTLKIASKYIDNVFEVIYKYHIKSEENFKMNPGFISFEPVKKGQILALSNNEIIKSEYNASLFMPLYQKTGEDGFFIIRKIQPFFLKLSAILRSIKADNLLVLLPGISWQNKQEGILRANLRVTRFMAKSIFHLLGYRNKQISGKYVLLHNRERTAKTNLYSNQHWY